jgi:DNA-binding NtrC family response regulator
MRHAIDAADVDRWFEQAPGGTLFIDDMSRLSRQGQEQLLLRLEHNALGQLGESNWAGGRRVRVIAGASRVLLAAVAANAFSETLYYRLNLIHVDRTGLKDS